MGRCKHVMAANLCLSRVGFAFLSACAHALCIVRLSIDGGHSAILSSTGVLYTFGSGATGELGHGSEVTASPVSRAPAARKAAIESVVPPTTMQPLGSPHRAATCGRGRTCHVRACA